MRHMESKITLFTNRAIVGFAIPIVFDALLAIAAGMIDSVMVSAAGEAAVSAVSLVDSINLLFIAAFSAIAVGGSVVTAQYMGSRDYSKAGVSANQLLYAATTIATLLMALLLPLRESLLRLVYGRIEADVFENASIYFFYTLLGYPFVAIGTSSAAVLRAMGKSRQSVAITIAYNVLNVLGNAVLIYRFRMGVAGAAISTTVSRVIYAILGLYLAHSRKLQAHFEKLLSFRLDGNMMRRVLLIGLTNGMENSMFHIGKILVASLVSSLGTVAIAANSVSSTINNIGWTIISSFGMVLLTVVGQCVGAHEMEQAKAYTKKLLTAATVAMFVIFGGIFFLRNQLVRLFDLDAQTLESCAYYTGAIALLSIFSLYSFSFVPMSVFRAAGDIRYAVTVSIVSMFAFRVALCYVLNAFFPDIGLMCVYLGMWADWIFRSILNCCRLHSGKWLRKSII